MPKPKSSVKRSMPAKSGVRKTHTPKSLSSLQDRWENTPVPEVMKRGILPEGTYQAVIEEALLDGDQVKFVYAITEPEEFAKRKAFKTMNLGDDEGIGMSILKGDLAILNVEMPADLESDLPETLASLSDVPVELFNRVKFNEKYGKEFANVFLNKRLDSAEDTSTVEENDDTPTDSEIAEGVTVSFKDGKKVIEGTVIKVEDEKVTVDVDGEEWEVELNEITMVETPAPVKKSPTKKAAPVVEDNDDWVGKTVEFESDGETMSGSVTGVDNKGNLEVEVNGEVWAVDPAECTEAQPKKGPVKKVAGPVKKRF